MTGQPYRSQELRQAVGFWIRLSGRQSWLPSRRRQTGTKRDVSNLWLHDLCQLLSHLLHSWALRCLWAHHPLVEVLSSTVIAVAPARGLIKLGANMATAHSLVDRVRGILRKGHPAAYYLVDNDAKGVHICLAQIVSRSGPDDLSGAGCVVRLPKLGRPVCRSRSSSQGRAWTCWVSVLSDDEASVKVNQLGSVENSSVSTLRLNNDVATLHVTMTRTLCVHKRQRRCCILQDLEGCELLLEFLMSSLQLLL
mmetsp:Transcript_52824/g.126151  ORF Transcript_52824/g.126151 Transcript_52824/m.126151 type:complete len:252 (-) Transcript_52824:894-1649(-)